MKSTKKILSAMVAAAMMMGVMTVMPITAAASTQTIRDITAHEFVKGMGTGWNLGNTFDAGGTAGSRANITAAQVAGVETSWLGGTSQATTQTLIQELKKQGFDTLRIPVTWNKVANPGNNWQINAHWMARVKQVVDWAIEEEMYVILNTHHENSSLNMGVAGADESDHAGNIFVTNIWRQIAEEFRDYGDKLIFAGLNEPRHQGGAQEWNGGTEIVRANLNHLNQAFVDTVRATGGNNTDRFLLVPTVAAGSNNNSLNAFRVPLDLPQHRITVGSGTNVGYGNTNISSSRIILAVHTYSPFNWAHDGLGVYGNGLNTIRTDLNRVQTRANQLGLPVILSEWGSVDTAMVRQGDNDVPDTNPANQTTRDNSRPVHAEDYVREARERGMVAVWWDNGGFGVGDHSFGIIRRAAPHNISDNHQNIIDAIMRGAGIDPDGCGNRDCRNTDCQCENCDCGTEMPDCLCEGSDIILDSVIGVYNDRTINLTQAAWGSQPHNVSGWWQHNIMAAINEHGPASSLHANLNAIEADRIEVTLKITAINSETSTRIKAPEDLSVQLFHEFPTVPHWENDDSEKRVAALNENITVTFKASAIRANTHAVGLEINMHDEMLPRAGDTATISYEIIDARIVGTKTVCFCLPWCCVDGPRICVNHTRSEDDCMKCSKSYCDYVFASASSLEKPKCNGCQQRCAPHTNREAGDCTVCDDCGIKGLDVKCGENDKCASCLCTHIPGAAATCLTAQICTTCERVLAPALGHAAGAPATCLTAQTCIRCPHIFTAALGHNMPPDWTIRTNPTTTAKGLEFRVCQREGCSFEETKEIPELPRSGGGRGGGGGGGGTTPPDTTPTPPPVQQATGIVNIIVNIPVTVINTININIPVTQLRVPAGGTGRTSVSVGTAHAGQHAVLVQYNAQTGELEFVTAAAVGTDGNANLNLPAAGDFLVMTFITGDVTGTGTVETADALALLRHIAGIAPLNSIQLFVANGKEGDVNTTDALNILKIVAGL
jgi:endoglucanase